MSGTDLRLNGSTSEGPDPAAAQVIFYFAGKETLFPVCKDDFLVPDIQFPDVAHVRQISSVHTQELPAETFLQITDIPGKIHIPFFPVKYDAVAFSSRLKVQDIVNRDVAHRVHKLYRKKLPGQASLCTSSQSIHVLFPFSIFFALT